MESTQIRFLDDNLIDSLDILLSEVLNLCVVCLHFPTLQIKHIICYLDSLSYKLLSHEIKGML